MKKLITSLLVLLMILSMTIALGACKKSSDVEEPKTAAEDTEEPTADDADKTEEDAEEQDIEEPAAEDLVKTIKPDAEDVIGQDLPMQISEVRHYRDGSVMITITDDLKKNELGDVDASSLMPFAESGKEEDSSNGKTGVVKEIYLMRVGNGGYRTLVALMDNGTISAINTRALIEDHIVAVMDNLGGRDSFTAVEQHESEDGFGVIAKTSEGEDVVLDPVLLIEEGDVQPAE